MQYMNWLKSSLPLAVIGLTACVSTPQTPADPANLANDEKALFTCMLDVSAPHKRIDIVEITMTAEELASAKADEQDADDEPPTDPDTTTMDKNVRLSVSELETASEGHCFRRNEGGKYVCQSFDGGLKLEWSGETPKDVEPAGPAEVKVKEKWIFGTKQYTATCTRKV